MFSGNRKASSDFIFSKSPSSPPPYRQTPLSPLSPLLLSEIKTTRTEVVTTTTTETTTQLLSIPYWRRRNISHPTSPACKTFEGFSGPPKSRPSHLLLLDKELPPTPPNKTTRELQPAAATRQPVLVSHSSTSQLGTSATSPLSPSTSVPPASPLPLPSQVRRVKSTLRLQSPGGTADKDHLVQRRRRGVSFGASTLLSVDGDTKSKGKGKEPEVDSNPSRSSPKPLSRKSSFWSKKKTHQPCESARSSRAQDDAILTLPPLPPVDISPFAAEFPSQHLESINLSVAPPQSKGHSATSGSTTASTSHSVDASVPMLPKQDVLSVPRLRAQTPSTLFQRLSLGVFSSPEPSPSVIRPSSQSPNLQLTSSIPVATKSDTAIPKPAVEEESPEIYVSRLKTQVSKAEVASILASSSDVFYVQALRVYLNQFDFSRIPLDVALRKLLMEVGLPRETQQIDRVIEAFALRYRQCNPNLFISDDHPYILAFSLIMLHTDFFNPSNKRKMTKADYIKNTKLPGIPVEVLDCFFENIVFAPFIFIEDPEDFDDQSTDLTGPLSASTPALPSAGVNTAFRTGNKVDPYYLIMKDQLDPLRVNVNSLVPLENPFTYEGKNGMWDEAELHGAFMRANVIEIYVATTNRPPAMFSLYGSGAIDFQDTRHLDRGTWRLKVTKVGLLNRKDDLLEGGKRALNRKWKTWSVVLAGSQLLFCRDPASASTLLLPSDRRLESPQNAVLRPDDFLCLKDAIAVYDRSYTKYNHTFRFIMPDGRHLLLQAANDEDLQQWISRINYASTFKTAGVRMRPAALSEEEVLRTGVAAATSHLHDMQRKSNDQSSDSSPSIAPNELMDMLTGQPKITPAFTPKITLAAGPPSSALDSPVSPESAEFKMTFDQVKADLAAESLSLESGRNVSPQLVESFYKSPLDYPGPLNKTSRFSPRSQAILSKIREIDSKLTSLKSQLESDERYLRNIAVLTPFRKSTRSRLLSAIQNLARPVMQVRLEVEKLQCHRAILHSDLISESRSRIQSKQIALRVAKDTLPPRRPKTAPTMSLSTHSDSRRKLSSDNVLNLTTGTPAFLTKSDLSPASGSFYSARESASDWSSADDENSTRTSLKLALRNPDAATSSSSVLVQAEQLERDGVLTQSPSTNRNSKDRDIHLNENDSSDRVSHDDDDDEQAEAWNKTRVAQRVSLIHVPSDIAMTTRLKQVLEGSFDEI